MARDEDDAVNADADEDRPRKKTRARDEDDSEKKEPAGATKPMPTRLVGAIAASLLWGFFLLHASCVRSSTLTLLVIELLRDRRVFGGGMILFDVAGSRSRIYAMLGIQMFLLLLSAVLLAGGILLLMRKGFAKFLAMGAPAGIVLIELIGFVIFLILTEGEFMAQHNLDFLINIVFSLAVAGLNAFLLLNKDVSRALT